MEYLNVPFLQLLNSQEVHCMQDNNLVWLSKVNVE